MALIKRLFRRPASPTRRPTARPNPFAGMSTRARLDACMTLGWYDSRIWEGW